MTSIFNPTKIDDLDLGFSVYPNPFINKVSIDGFEKFDQFLLIDLNGKEIFRGKPSKYLSLKNLRFGHYNLILKNENILHSVKLLKN